jgi:hypothetical protein
MAKRIAASERFAEAERQQEDALPVSYANHRFLYAHFPRSWTFYDEVGEFLPNLNQVIAKPGCNGVDNSGNMTGALAGAIGKGGTVIRDTDARLGDHKHYVGVTKCVGGRRHHAFYGDGYIQLGPDDFMIDHDRTLWIDFLQTIKRSGIIEPMDAMVYRAQLQGQTTRLNRLSRRTGVLPERIEKVQARLVAMKTAWEASHKPVKAKPVKRRRTAIKETTA